MFTDPSYSGNKALVANKVQTLVSTPPTSHLALRGKLKGQVSCLLSDGKREGSKNAAESSTFYLLRPRPKSIRSHVSFSTPPDFPTQSHKSAARKTNQSTRECNLLPLKSCTVERFGHPEDLRVSQSSTRETATRSVNAVGTYGELISNRKRTHTDLCKNQAVFCWCRLKWFFFSLLTDEKWICIHRHPYSPCERL